MTLDSEQQKAALLQLIRASTFSGEQLEFIHELYKAIANATVVRSFDNSSAVMRVDQDDNAII